VEIVGRPYVFGDPEQTKWIQEQYKKEDLQNNIISGLQKAVDSIDEYVHEFTSTEELRNTIKQAIDALKYISGTVYNDELEMEKIVNDRIEIVWMES